MEQLTTEIHICTSWCRRFLPPARPPAVSFVLAFWSSQSSEFRTLYSPPGVDRKAPRPRTLCVRARGPPLTRIYEHEPRAKREASPFALFSVCYNPRFRRFLACDARTREHEEVPP